MNIDLTTNLESFNGEPLIASVEQDDQGQVISKEPWTLKKVFGEALMNVLESDKESDAKQKIDRYELARSIYNSSVLDLSTEQLSMLKDRVNKMFDSPIVIGEVDRIIEGRS